VLRPCSLPDKALQSARARLRDEGFTHCAGSKLRWSADMGALADAVVALMQHGWPPTFLLAFDEVWAMQREVSGLLAAASGGNVPNCDTLVWCAGGSGSCGGACAAASVQRARRRKGGARAVDGRAGCGRARGARGDAARGQRSARLRGVAGGCASGALLKARAAPQVCGPFARRRGL
jgi:hypothetical protein